MAMSNESNKEQLRLARGQGEAEGTALRWIEEHAPGLHGETRAGALRLVYTLTAPEGSYRLRDGQLAWAEPAPDATAHLRVFAMDAGDGRLVPGLTLRATLVDAAGHEAALSALPFAWYPLLNGYGSNVRLPGSGMYHVRLQIEPPLFRRHDPYNGYRYTTPLVAEFAPVHLQVATLRASLPATEAEEGESDLAAGQASALRRTLVNMYKTAIGGKDQRVGDYIVANANEYSEAYWYFDTGHFVLATEMENSAARNSHVEVAVMDAETGRFVPGLRVQATLTDANGREVGSHAEPLMWHPWLWHYGENWRIPHNGRYRVHVHFDAPDFARYGRKAGHIMGEPVDCDFPGQKLISGQK